MPVEASEDIARAICTEKFDPVTGRVSTGLFRGFNISVSRLSICPLEETWELFRQRVEKPPERTLQRIGVINVGRLSNIGMTFKANPTALTVEPAPLEGYRSHAVIPEKISNGLATEIIKNLALEKER